MQDLNLVFFYYSHFCYSFRRYLWGGGFQKALATDPNEANRVATVNLDASHMVSTAIYVLDHHTIS